MNEGKTKIIEKRLETKEKEENGRGRKFKKRSKNEWD